MTSAPGLVINLPGYPFQNLSSVSAIASLRAIDVSTVAAGANYLVDGLAAIGDGGGGIFVWTPASAAADNGSTIIRPSSLTPLQAGRWIAIGSSGTVSGFLAVPVPSVSFPTLASAILFVRGLDIVGTGFVSIVLTGTFGSPSAPIVGIDIFDDWSNKVAIDGSTTNKADTKLYIDATNNRNGIACQNGAKLSRISNLTIIGVGALASSTSTTTPTATGVTNVWNAQCVGCGVVAYNGGEVGLIDNVTVDSFYYGVKAVKSGVINCTSTVSVIRAGDVGFHAKDNSSLYCKGASGTYCADNAAGLGGAFCAESGSFMWAQGAYAGHCNVAGITSASASDMWAQNTISELHGSDGYLISGAVMDFTGGEGRLNGRYGVNLQALASGGGNGAYLHNNGNHGVQVSGNSWVDVTSLRTYNNGGGGVNCVNGGIAAGDATDAQNNGLTAFYADHDGQHFGANKNVRGVPTGQYAFYAQFGGKMNVPTPNFGTGTGSVPSGQQYSPTPGIAGGNTFSFIRN